MVLLVQAESDHVIVGRVMDLYRSHVKDPAEETCEPVVYKNEATGAVSRW